MWLAWLLGLLARRRRGGVLTLTYVDATIATTADAALPAGTQEGDLLIYLSGAGNPTVDVPADVTPPDWVSGPMVTGSGFRSKIMAGVATAGNISDGYVTGLSGINNSVGILAAIRPSMPIAALTYLDVENTVGNGNPTAQVVGASAGAAPLVVTAGYRSSGAIDPRTWTGSTPTVELGPTAAGNHWLKLGIFNSSPADISVDMDDEGNNNGLLTGYLEVS